MTAKKATKKAAPKKAAKKTAKKTAAAVPTEGPPDLTLPGSPCTSRGNELPGSVRVRVDDRVELFFQVCASPAQLVISLHEVSPTSSGGNFIFDARIPPPNPVVIPLALGAGRYIVQWGYLVVGPSWEVVAEIQVNGAPLFRKVNTHEDDKPFNSIFAALEVLP